MSSLKARIVENPCQKSLKLMLSSNMNIGLGRHHQISETDESSAVKYNSDLLKALESDYKTKNSSLFTWRHNVSQQEYIRVPTSSKKTVSQDIRLEDITDIAGPPESATSMNSPLNKYANMRITDTCFNPFRNIEMRKRPKTRDMTNECFDGVSEKHKKSYSVTKLQMDLLSNEASGPENVPNFEFMTNQFDRKNYTVNKIISQISAQNERLDKADIKAETVRKLQYVTGNMKPQKILKPKTAATSMTRSKILFSPKDVRSSELEFPFGSENKLSQQKFSITINSKKGKGLKYLLDIPDQDSLYNNSKGNRTSLATRMEDGSELQLINKAKYGHVVQRISKSHRAKEPIKTDKSSSKWFIEGVGTGIKEMEKRIDEEMQGKDAQREVKSSRFFVRVQPRDGFRGTLTPKHEKGPLVSPDRMKELNDENIFNFGKYFKKKYMEKETPFQVSKGLQKRINSFEKGLQASARMSQIFGKSMQLSENIKY